MKLLTTIMAGSLLLTAAQVQAEDNFHYDYATVLQSTPVIRIVEVTQQKQQCRPEEVVYRQANRKSGGGSSSLVGGILGAAIGHAIGHKSKHRTGATIAGAFVGATIAGNSNNNHRFYSERRVLENRCRLVPTSYEEERIIGYNVVYRYNGRTFETRLDFDPSSSLKIRVLLSPINDSEKL